MLLVFLCSFVFISFDICDFLSPTLIIFSFHEDFLAALDNVNGEFYL